MKRFVLPGFLTLCAVLPAMAADWPSDNYMKASTTYNSAATSTHMGVASGSTTADAYYTIAAGYYLPKSSYSASVCPAGKYCVGATAVKYSSSTAQGGASASAAPGAVSEGYWASSGAKTATPTSSSDCVGSSPSCGKCMSGYSSSAGSTSYTACRKSGTTACSSVMPVDATYPYTSVIYNSNNASFDENQTAGTTLTGLKCTISQTSATTPGSCVIDDVRSCYVRGATCDDADYDLVMYTLGKGVNSSSIQEWTSPSASVSSNNIVVQESVANPGLGTFYVPFGDVSAVRGISMQVSSCTESTGHLSCTLNSSGANCACQLQTISKGSRAYPVTSEWTVVTKGTDGCARTCANQFSTTTDIGSKFTIHPYKCVPHQNTVVLNSNGGTGQIRNKTATSSQNTVIVQCAADKVIGTFLVWNSTVGTNAYATNLVKGTATDSSSAKVFIGFGESATSTTPTNKLCTTANTVSSDPSSEGDAIPYYAIWAKPECNANTNGSATNVTFNKVNANKVVCNRKNAAGYWCPTTFEGEEGVPSLTVSCSACKTNWTSTAGSATAETNCTRSITLDKNGATAGSAYSGLATSKTCNYNTNCTLPDVTAGKLTKPGYTSTGWGTTTSCTSTSNVIKSTDTAATVKAYVCWTANSITITWTGVKTVPSSGFSAISNSTATSNVSYGGNIVTPTAAVAATAGQTFLGWKFTSAQ